MERRREGGERKLCPRPGDLDRARSNGHRSWVAHLGQNYTRARLRRENGKEMDGVYVVSSTAFHQGSTDNLQVDKAGEGSPATDMTQQRNNRD
ncbi:uncharacterized protein LY79DRAFT_181670 [Colletotrichum navitas]|uniref:Uncharacterized protein n=1 Tax=Colletotrichum navitas TaxID=681940 RepID=A0AAD8V5C3_9PEZI|nr:uncharacterized protein LY79DRAFT_181670 [Colletotrichum navitas]KAK1593253.1 hypothetical protein LY79DRAFT_181670 [Colletotrichum navitas]